MNHREIIFLRQTRHKIVEISGYIYEKKWETVDEYWKVWGPKLSRVAEKDVRFYDILRQCKESMIKANYLRLLDLLIYEIDSYIMEYLCSLSEEPRKFLAEEAKRSNTVVLGIYHRDILKRIESENIVSRIDCAYKGTENVSISVIEGKYKFRLFSEVNPWSESADLVSEFGKEAYEEIHVLGFGGGYWLEELVRRHPETKITVYLPNLDIFNAVVCNIPVDDILQHEKLKLCADPICLKFFFTMEKMTEKNGRIGFYVDYQELRACLGNTFESKQLMNRLSKRKEKIICAENKGIGEIINRYIKTLGEQ